MSHKQSIEFLHDYLEPRGYRFEVLNLGMKKTEYTFIGSVVSGNKLAFLSSDPLYPFATSSARMISKDKLISYDLMRHLNVNCPKTVIIKKADIGWEAAKELLNDCISVIVKPYNKSGSSGLTLDIHNHDQLDVAVYKALENSKTALVQEQFIGEEVRFVAIDGEIQAAILRQKPRVIGDGQSSIRQLIDQENVSRSALNGMAVQYPQLTENIVKAEILNDTRIPAHGEIIELNKSTMISGGASIYNILDTIEPSYVRIAQKIATQMGRGFVVVDMMIEDIKSPANSNNYVFIEMNLAPAIALFYSCRDGRHFRVVEDYLGPMLETLLN